jgi:hypothetical protein
MNLHALAIPTFTQMLRALSAQLDKGVELARAKGFEPSVLPRSRLAPDMFPLAAQVRFTCFQASDAVARLTGQAPRVMPGDETTIEGLKAVIAETIADLEATPEAAFAGAEDRMIELKMANGLIFDMNGLQFLRDWSLAQFYFHLVTAYDILRHKGVPLGKPDYVPHALPYLRPGTAPGA